MSDLYRKHFTVVKILFISCLLGACAQQASLPPEASPLPSIAFDNSLFGEPVDIETEAELFYLSEAQKNEFLSYYNDPDLSDTDDYIKVFDFLSNSTYNFSYKATTNTASIALSKGEGNCMSLAILTTALARLVDVKVKYQLVDSTPVFERKDDVIIKGVHVRTKLIRTRKNRDLNMVSFITPGLIVDYFPGGDLRFLGNISHEEFIALYYLNIAADHIREKDYNSAYWYTLKALAYAPSDQSAINNMAIIHRRIGAERKAEQIYRYGIEVADEKLSLLKNYKTLLLKQKRYDEAIEIAERIDRFDDPSPYNWINIADEAYKNQNYSDARKYYLRAVEVAPYLQYAYLGLARVYHAQGKKDKAKDMLIRAMENNHSRDNARMYKAKLFALKKDGTLNLDVQ